MWVISMLAGGPNVFSVLKSSNEIGLGKKNVAYICSGNT